MKKLKLENLELSEIGLGGSKFVNMTVDEGKKLVSFVIDLGVNVVDGHHRYGVAEEVYSYFPNVVHMTKVSAYKDNWRELVENSKKVLGRIDIMWVSDLDDISLYERGKAIYNELKIEFPLLGITTESPRMLYKFWKEFPQCKLFMVPIFVDMPWEMIGIIEVLKIEGKFIFGIKSFLDGLLLQKLSVKTCLEFVKKISPSVLLVGVSNSQHLEEVINIYNSL